MLAISVGVALPAASYLGESRARVVGRDLVEPPLDIQAYPSPMASFRHYTTDLKDETLITVSDLPENQRVRIAAMDVYDGTTFGMSETEGMATPATSPSRRRSLGVPKAIQPSPCQPTACPARGYPS